MKLHILKLESRFWNKVIDETKRFEIRNNDRDFAYGDIVMFRDVHDETNIMGSYYVIDYILEAHEFPQGIQDGYCVFSIKKVWG